MSPWVDLFSQTAMSAAFSATMIFLSSKLPSVFKERVKVRIDRELVKQGPISARLALELTMICADFSGSTSAILALFMSILFEIWKLYPLFPMVVSGILFFGVLGAVAGTLKVLSLPWADLSEEEYRVGLGKHLAWLVYILSAVLVVVAAIGPSVQLSKAPTTEASQSHSPDSSVHQPTATSAARP